MTIWWCAGCGMEDTRSHVSCSSCGSALQTGRVDWLDEVDRDRETVFELDPEPIERAAIVDGLMSKYISHRWEGTNDLVVHDADADAVDAILDEVLGADTREDAEGEGDKDVDYDQDIDGDGAPDYEEGSDNGYEVLSELYVATNRLAKHRDADDVSDYIAVTKLALSTAQPFGVDEETWADIQSAARNISAQLEVDTKAPVDADLKGLRNQLQQLV